MTLVDIAAQSPAQIQLLPLTALRDVRIIEGELVHLLAVGKTDAKREDYLMVRLLDKHAILDAMGKLRSVYPNVLHLERTGLMAGDQAVVLNRDHIKKGEMAMFHDFFAQVSGDELTPAQQAVMEDILTQLHRDELERSETHRDVKEEQAE